jgi:hypothetical protein
MKKKLQRENELFLKPTSVIHIDDVTMTGEDVAIMI